MIRKALMMAVATLGILIAVPAATAQAATPANVHGTWGSVDIDGSNQVMMVKDNGNGSFAVSLLDDWATICRGGPALAIGTGALARDTLEVRYEVRCFNGNPAGPATVPYLYTAANDTLTDGVGVVWTHLSSTP